MSTECNCTQDAWSFGETQNYTMKLGEGPSNFQFICQVLYDPGCLLDQKDTGSCKTHKARLCYHLSVRKDTSPECVLPHAPVTCSSIFPTPLPRVHPWIEDGRSQSKTWLPGLAALTWRKHHLKWNIL